MNIKDKLVSWAQWFPPVVLGCSFPVEAAMGLPQPFARLQRSPASLAPRAGQGAGLLPPLLLFNAGWAAGKGEGRDSSLCFAYIKKAPLANFGSRKGRHFLIRLRRQNILAWLWPAFKSGLGWRRGQAAEPPCHDSV